MDDLHPCIATWHMLRLRAMVRLASFLFFLPRLELGTTARGIMLALALICVRKEQLTTSEEDRRFTYSHHRLR